MLKKVAWATEQRQRLGLAFAIGVDGGIGSETIGQAAAAGADFFAVGSAVFNGDITDNVRHLLAHAASQSKE